MPAKVVKKRILVIEDEKPLARALELKLVHEGFEVLGAANGEIAISLLTSDKFSLVICDLIMPKVDGFQVLEFIRDQKIKTPVIILTNLSQSEDEKRVRALGASEFFVKSNTSILKIIEHVKEKVS
ncbi:MAG: response regulator [Candidatus Falkowbacteria bacterium]|nr:response regulator [Candidatus Falkowbacteria bacterium]